MSDTDHHADKNRDARGALERVKEVVAGMEAEARKLKNQNLADVFKSAYGRLVQALEHPDLDRLGVSEDQRDMLAEVDPNMQSGGSAAFAAGDPGAAAANEEARRRAAFNAAGQPYDFPGGNPAG